MNYITRKILGWETTSRLLKFTKIDAFCVDVLRDLEAYEEKNAELIYYQKLIANVQEKRISNFHLDKHKNIILQSKDEKFIVTPSELNVLLNAKIASLECDVSAIEKRIQAYNFKE